MFETFVNMLVGSVKQRERLVPAWAWLRVEFLADDLRRVYQRVTGLAYPRDACTLAHEGASCYEGYYDIVAPETVRRVVERDAWIFSYFVPGGPVPNVPAQVARGRHRKFPGTPPGARGILGSTK